MIKRFLEWLTGYDSAQADKVLLDYGFAAAIAAYLFSVFVLRSAQMAAVTGGTVFLGASANIVQVILKGGGRGEG
jgi:predicted MFS family arabinose efflux permease